MTITGELATFLAVLGQRQGATPILDAIVLVGPQMETESFDWGDDQVSTYFAFTDAGTDLIFENDVLTSSIIRTQPDPEDESYGVYPRPDALIDGLPMSADRAQVAAMFGSPERTGPDFDRYQVNGHYLRFGFRGDRIATLSPMLEPV